MGPKQVVVLHCWGHQKSETSTVQGNQKADREAKWTAHTGRQTSTSLTAASFPCPLSEWDPWYTPQEQAWFKTEEVNVLPSRWWKFADGRILIPESESLAPTFVKQFHEGTHSRQTAFKITLAQHFMSPSSPAYVTGAVCVPKIIPNKGQEHHPRCKVLEGLLLKTWL
jgi:hypothetical protein